MFIITMEQFIMLQQAIHNYNGTVCNTPVGNSYCQVLKNIMKNKNIGEEYKIAGYFFSDCAKKPSTGSVKNMDYAQWL